ncbi:inositol monophosphatase family protein [Paracoccus sp. (in: a-proteobacteria)]|uniref:inositol monophosphatase family protein n=1 Tax=Paracoccus sp. TaxID=267 RepID=UPI0026DFF676|nr:inositol monophosphatase family protein [Paracoccus sp. (in: a-proteobacteria)]MDO5647627.1 inositol monophosphatase family protein [Paracoccus sp. (in: a-proteobacteria)]
MTLSDTERSALIAAVRDAARTHILPRFRSLSPSDIASKSAPDDLVTAADLASEAALTDAARTILPGCVVVGEEAAAADPALPSRLMYADTAVIIDPVDGTWNFAQGLSTFGVILSVMRGGQTVFGLHYDPLNDDWIWAGLGQGAWLDRSTQGGGTHRLTLPQAAPRPASALFGMLSPWLFDASKRSAAIAAQTQFARTAALRCSCHEYRLLVQGSVDFLLSATAKPWDHVAGVLLTAEAGGVSAMLDGSDYIPGISEGTLINARNAGELETIRKTWWQAMG